MGDHKKNNNTNTYDSQPQNNHGTLHEKSVRRRDDAREEARQHRLPPQHREQQNNWKTPYNNNNNNHDDDNCRTFDSRPSTSSSMRDERLDTRRRERMERITGVVPRSDRRVHSTKLKNKEKEQRQIYNNNEMNQFRNSSKNRNRKHHSHYSDEEEEEEEEEERDRRRGRRHKTKEKKKNKSHRRKKGDHRKEHPSLSHTREGLNMRRDSHARDIRGVAVNKSNVLEQSRRLKARNDSRRHQPHQTNHQQSERRSKTKEWNEDEDLWLTDKIGDLKIQKNAYEERLKSHQEETKGSSRSSSARGNSSHYNVITGTWSDTGSVR